MLHPQLVNRKILSGSSCHLRTLGSGFFMQTARMCGAGGGWLIVGAVQRSCVGCPGERSNRKLPGR